jgi:hypothetical protein
MPATTRALVCVDDQFAVEAVVGPGRHILPLTSPPPTSDAATAQVRLEFPDEPLRPDGFLWPFRVLTVNLGPAGAEPS